MNKSQSVLTGKLEMCAGNNILTVPYKIDTGSDGNIMPGYIYVRNCFQQLEKLNSEKTVKKHIKLKTYNKTVITQLGTCMVIIDY